MKNQQHIEQNRPLVALLCSAKNVLILSILLKLALIPAYRSTDFEVHRNWLAITYSLPLKDWYYENTSEWTLDYPPFFAWFEYILSQFAQFFDINMLNVKNLNYESIETIYFQRLSVILVDLVWFYACYKYTTSSDSSIHPKTSNSLQLAFIFLCAGLIIVDNIHFQYNGFMYGLQILSLVMFKDNKFLMGGALFALLLNMKHIYLYQAPAYFVFIFSAYCWQQQPSFFSCLYTLLKMGLVVVSIFALSFGPFFNHIPQILSRLFPFKRGLCHSYWAPNIWALYSFLDRVSIPILRIFKLDSFITPTQSLTRGIVGDTQFSVLPNVSPIVTFILTLITQLPALFILWKRPDTRSFIQCLVLTGFCSYLFGWHVHEKAILMVLIPTSLLVMDSPVYARLFYVMNAAGTLSLFPLLIKPHEFLVKVGLLGTSLTGSYFFFSKTHDKKFRLYLYEKYYLIILFLAFVVAEVIHPLLVPLSKCNLTLWFSSPRFYVSLQPLHLVYEKTQFLPLMILSVVCAVGLMYTWIALYVTFILSFFQSKSNSSRTELKEHSTKSGNCRDSKSLQGTRAKKD